MEPVISVVTGTYNRYVHLRNMVESVRRSIYRLPYEIVVVDGGSKDDTLKWCKPQPDITLIQHGALLGAVKAFNDGAYAARGDYVLLANDDIEFQGNSILAALSFIQDDLNIGIACFYQDRGGKDLHVEVMPAMGPDGKPVTVPYGQVCMVPRWLGNKVGWWGDYLHTYGGDNELSCNVLEHGYEVHPAPCTAIHDSTPQDELRKINNPPTDKIHPDSMAWRTKWQRRGRFDHFGPAINSKERFYNPLARVKRIFYAPIYEPGWGELQRNTKKGLRQALSRHGWVIEHDYMHAGLDDMIDAACAYDPDLFVIQVHDPKTFTLQTIQALRYNHPKAKFVLWNGDYHPDDLYRAQYLSIAKTFDLCGFVTTTIGDYYDAAGVNWFYWQIGYETGLNDNIPEPDKRTPRYDVLFMGNGYSQERVKLGKYLRSMDSYKVGIYGYWPDGMRVDGLTLYDFEYGAKLYRACKIAISDSQWPDATGFVSNRLFQAMSAGALLFQQQFDGLDTLLGMIDGKHLIVWKNLRELKSLIAYWLEHSEEAKTIALAGQALVLEKHSFDARVREMLHELGVTREYPEII